MVVIRLARGGKKKKPFHHIVVADSRQPRDGRRIELLGYYNPCARGGAVPYQIQLDRYQYWIAQGAQPSSRVHQLIKHWA